MIPLQLISYQNQQLVRQYNYSMKNFPLGQGLENYKVNWMKLAVRVTWSSTPCMWQTVSFI